MMKKEESKALKLMKTTHSGSSFTMQHRVPDSTGAMLISNCTDPTPLTLNACVHHPLGRINSAVSEPFVCKPQEDSVFLCNFLLLPDDSQSVRAMKVDAVQIDPPGKKKIPL